jgi:hypothetical protein
VAKYFAWADHFSADDNWNNKKAATPMGVAASIDTLIFQFATVSICYCTVAP